MGSRQEVAAQATRKGVTEPRKKRDMYTHRPLQERDLESICMFPLSGEELFCMFPKARYPLTPRQLLDAARNRRDPSVVLVNEVVVGYANFIEVHEGDHCSIGNLVIKSLERGKGAASYLVKTFIDLAFQRYMANYVRISCFSHNAAGLLLYYKLGFRPVDMEERKGPDGKRVALIHMHLSREVIC